MRTLPDEFETSLFDWSVPPVGPTDVRGGVIVVAVLRVP